MLFKESVTIKIETIAPDLAEELCRKITADLPEYFGLPEVNEYCAIGVRSLLNLAACIGIYMLKSLNDLCKNRANDILILVLALIIICYPQIYFFNDKVHYKNFYVYYDKKIPLL